MPRKYTKKIKPVVSAIPDDLTKLTNNPYRNMPPKENTLVAVPVSPLSEDNVDYKFLHFFHSVVSSQMDKNRYNKIVSLFHELNNLPPFVISSKS